MGSSNDIRHSDDSARAFWRDCHSHALDLAAANLPSVQQLHQLASNLTNFDLERLPVVTAQEMHLIRSRCMLNGIHIEPVLNNDLSANLARLLTSETTAVIGAWRDIRTGGSELDLRLGLARQLMSEAIANDSPVSLEIFRILAPVQDDRLWTDLGVHFLHHKYFFDAERAFLRANRHDLALRVTLSRRVILNHLIGSPDDSPALVHDLKLLLPPLEASFASWCQEHRVRPRSGQLASYLLGSLQLASELAHQYEYGIAVAHSGLALGWAFSIFGLDVGIVKTRRREGGVQLTDSSALLTDRIAGKSVIILENDMVSGQTLQAALKKITPLNPLYVDVAFNLIYASSARGDTTAILNRMPREIRRVFAPESFGIVALVNALEIVKSIGSSIHRS